jgi:hypothetical protein
VEAQRRRICEDGLVTLFVSHTCSKSAANTFELCHEKTDCSSIFFLLVPNFYTTSISMLAEECTHRLTNCGTSLARYVKEVIALPISDNWPGLVSGRHAREQPHWRLNHSPFFNFVPRSHTATHTLLRLIPWTRKYLANLKGTHSSDQKRGCRQYPSDRPREPRMASFMSRIAMFALHCHHRRLSGLQSFCRAFPRDQKLGV